MDLSEGGDNGTFYASFRKMDPKGDTYKMATLIDRGDGRMEIGFIQNGQDVFDEITLQTYPGGGSASASHLPHSTQGYQETFKW